MRNTNFVIPVCHTSRREFIEFALCSRHFTHRQLQRVIGGLK